jgi:hypothetical protein
VRATVEDEAPTIQLGVGLIDGPLAAGSGGTVGINGGGNPYALCQTNPQITH